MKKDPRKERQLIRNKRANSVMQHVSYHLDGCVPTRLSRKKSSGYARPYPRRLQIALAEELDQRGIELVSIRDQIDTSTAVGKAMFRMLMVLAEKWGTGYHCRTYEGGLGGGESAW